MIEALLGLDIGTTSTKAVLFDLDGKELARAASAPYTNHTPRPGWVEQDPEEIWGAVLTVLQEALVSAGTGVHVHGLCMAAQSGSLQPADKQGAPVYSLITWMDGRTEALVHRWRAEGVQEWVKPQSGWTLYPGLCLPTIAWIREQDPDLFAKAQHYFSVNDFIAFRLTGQRVTNPSNAGGMQLVDVHTASWGEALCNLAGIKQSQLSYLNPSGAVIGPVKPEICRAVGLSEDAMLINGGHDQGCTALGMGIINPGMLLLACGTAWVFTGVVLSPDRARIPDTLDINFHVLPDRWTISQSLGGLGVSLEWWLKQAWEGERSVRYRALDMEMASAEPNDRLYFVPLTGGHDDPSTSRAGGFLGLQLSHNRAAMARAIMESAGYELAWALEAVVDAGMPVDSLSMVGGAASSPYWPGILTNITGVPIEKPVFEIWPALGAAVLAGSGLGLYPDIEHALTLFRKETEKVNPERALLSFYAGASAGYREACLRARGQSEGT
ncbi:MAG: hypothetical protein JXA25_19130 [Anaerolineales bacterium]|nr:hypothetical protein [Anaerolineales bacterium]